MLGYWRLDDTLYCENTTTTRAVLGREAGAGRRAQAADRRTEKNRPDSKCGARDRVSESERVV